MKKSKCHNFLEIQPKGVEEHGHRLDPQNSWSLLFSSRVTGDDTLFLQDARDSCASLYGFQLTVNSMVYHGNAPWSIPFYLVDFSFHVIQQPVHVWGGMSWHPSEPEAGACVLVTPVLLTQLLMRSALCPLLSHNAKIMWMLRSSGMCEKWIQTLPTWSRIRLGGSKVSLPLFSYRTGLYSVINRDLNTQIQDMIFKPRTAMISLPPCHQETDFLTSNFLWLNACEGLQGSVRPKFASWKRWKLRFLKRTQNQGKGPVW